MKVTRTVTRTVREITVAINQKAIKRQQMMHLLSFYGVIVKMIDSEHGER